MLRYGLQAPLVHSLFGTVDGSELRSLSVVVVSDGAKDLKSPDSYIALVDDSDDIE